MKKLTKTELNTHKDYISGYVSLLSTEEMSEEMEIEIEDTETGKIITSGTFNPYDFVESASIIKTEEINELKNTIERYEKFLNRMSIKTEYYDIDDMIDGLEDYDVVNQKG